MSSTIHTTITLQPGGTLARVVIQVSREESQEPVVISKLESVDLLYERVQGEFNNALRLQITQLQRKAKQLRGK